MKTTCLAKINNIIALCHIMDKYEEFKKNLIQSLPSIYNQSFLVQLKDISIKHRVLFGSTRAKKFYEENKQVIDIINQYSDIMSFINEINNHETGKANGSIQAFYEYISNSQTSIDKIKQVLEKLKSLGVETLKLSEDEDFTQQDFYLNPEFNQNETISFLDNIQVIPNCTGYIKYSTAGSNYKIIAMICYDEFASVGRTAILNSLVFDPNRLPNELDKENTFDIILKLGEEKSDKSNNMRNSIDLELSINEFETQFNELDAVVNNLVGVENKKQMIEALSRISSEITTLKNLSNDYTEKVAEQCSDLDPAAMNIEKEKYIKRRELAKMEVY